MEQVVLSLIAQSARRLGLPFDSPIVDRARMVACDALAFGYDAEAAHEFARQVLLNSDARVSAA